MLAKELSSQPPASTNQPLRQQPTDNHSPPLLRAALPSSYTPSYSNIYSEQSNTNFMSALRMGEHVAPPPASLPHRHSVVPHHSLRSQPSLNAEQPRPLLNSQAMQQPSLDYTRAEYTSASSFVEETSKHFSTPPIATVQTRSAAASVSNDVLSQEEIIAVAQSQNSRHRLLRLEPTGIREARANGD